MNSHIIFIVVTASRLAGWLLVLFLLTGCNKSSHPERDAIFIVSSSASAGGTVFPEYRTVLGGQVTAFSILPDEGYRIATATGCGGSLSDHIYTTDVISTQCSIAVTFELNDFTVGAVVSGGGRIAPDSAMVSYGTSTTFTLSPDEGYTLASANGCDGTLTGNVFTTGIIREHCLVLVVFDLSHYEIHASAEVGGSIQPASVSVSHGASTVFEVSNEEGFELATISGCNGVLDGASYITSAIVEHCEVTASFVVAAPQLLDVVAGDSELTFSWLGISGGESYNLYVDTEPNIDVTSFPATASGTLLENVSNPFTLTGLTNNTAYYAVVTATVGSMEGLTSNEIIAAPEAPFVAIGGLNDTGIYWCADATMNQQDCPVVGMGYQGQDGDSGRDAAARAGALTKLGHGATGFDFTKIAANGNALALQNTPWDADGSEAEGSQWSCVRDNVTGLIWEVKTQDGGLHDQSNTYSWFEPDSTSNGGEDGTLNGGSCLGSDCDTHAYVMAVNSNGLCGANDWRLPTRFELLGLLHNGRVNPSIDIDFFPNTPTGSYWWTSSSYAGYSSYAWGIAFYYGYPNFRYKHYGYHVRLVRHAL